MFTSSSRKFSCSVGTMLPSCNSSKRSLGKIGLILAVDLLLLLPLCVAVIAEDVDKPLSSSANNPAETTECEYYNGTACLAGDPDCRGTERCNLHEKKISAHARCYVLWTNSSDGKIEVEMKGCFIGDNSCLNQTKCIAREEHNVVKKERPHIYCCCRSNNCNRQFSWQPTPEHLHKPVDGQENNVIVLVLCPLGALAVVGILIVLGYYCYRKRKMQPYFHPLPSGVGSDCTSPGASASIPESVSQHTSVSTLCPVPHKPVKLLEVKAKGRFGALWMALRDTEYVAVKIFPASDFDSWHVEKEVYGLPQFHHPNILEFMGVEKHGENMLAEYWLISAYHYRGSLSDYLKAEVVSWSQVRRIALTMAQGLCYLHEELPATATEAAKPIIAHRDFKSKNVLLKADLTACIADFGLAIVFYGGQSTGDTRGQVGTRRYMAPEVLEGAISFQTDAILRIDMYACGLVLWELVSRCTGLGGRVEEYKLPFEEEVGYHPTLDDMQECVVVQKCRPAIKKNWLNHPGVEVMVSTMEECWDHDFEARLTAACVVERLSGVSSTDSIVLPDPEEPPSYRHKDNLPGHGIRGQDVASLRGYCPDNPDRLFKNANIPGQQMLGQCPGYGFGGGTYNKAPQSNNVASVIYGKKLMPAELHSGNVSLSSSGVSIPDKYNANTSSGSSNGSCSSSNSGGSDSVINHHIALSNSIPRPITTKPMVLPSINVPLPQPLSPNMTSKLPSGDGGQVQLPTVMVPVMHKQQPQLQQTLQDRQVAPLVP